MSTKSFAPKCMFPPLIVSCASVKGTNQYSGSTSHKIESSNRRSPRHDERSLLVAFLGTDQRNRLPFRAGKAVNPVSTALSHLCDQLHQQYTDWRGVVKRPEFYHPETSHRCQCITTEAECKLHICREESESTGWSFDGDVPPPIHRLDEGGKTTSAASSSVMCTEKSKGCEADLGIAAFKRKRDRLIIATLTAAIDFKEQLLAHYF
ncbi:hypothetical protein EDD85DRAFT_794562 [Armillaria nabsnona]|nr:hypothetical protein EDD85DRAFT_794562 [Armillaria nabsnona]